MKKKLLVIGLGNPLSGDDGYGHRVLELLGRDYPAIRGCCDLVDAHTDLLGWIDSFARYERVVLVDALLDSRQSLGRAGAVIELGSESLDLLPEAASGVHIVSPLIAMRLFKRLNPDADTHFTLIALCTDRIAVGDVTRLTDAAVAEGCNKIVEMSNAADPGACDPGCR